MRRPGTPTAPPYRHVRPDDARQAKGGGRPYLPVRFPVRVAGLPDSLGAAFFSLYLPRSLPIPRRLNRRLTADSALTKPLTGGFGANRR